MAIRAKVNGEPPLTSLCVRQDGTIGPGYARAPKSVIETPGEDIEYYAHSIACCATRSTLRICLQMAANLHSQRQNHSGERGKQRRSQPAEPYALCTVQNFRRQGAATTASEIT